ncbi:hypothetical protein HKX48_004948 [Thoreauomyces humboldtii]|nr:hypothetical protein HKX48_004948 [Thoreauomyces humboldtii]
MLGYNTLITVSILTFPVFAQGLRVSILRSQVNKAPATLTATPATEAVTIGEAALQVARDSASLFVPLILLVDARTAFLPPSDVVKMVATWAVIGVVVGRSLLFASLATSKSLFNPGPLQTVGTYGSYICGGVLALLPLWLL